MSKNGLLDVFMDSHDTANRRTDIHGTAQNFFWHSYWLYEMENSFRDIGTEYECFTLPYWDVTNDEAAWTLMGYEDISKLPIYNSNLGGEGSLENDYCVTGDSWTVADYTTSYLCADDEVSPDCCLKRYHTEPYDDMLASRKTFAGIIYVDKAYTEFDDYSTMINQIHGQIHMFVGSVDEHTHFNSDAGEPEVDPLFPLFHNFLTYLIQMRADCNQFDLLDDGELEDYIPYSYSDTTTCTLDYEMNFYSLCDGVDGERIRMCSHENMTPRMLYDLSPNGRFKVKYELGDFWSLSDELRTSCVANLNSMWWSIDDTDADDATKAIFEDQEELERSEFVSDHVAASMGSSPVSLQVIAVMVIGIAVLALLRLCTSKGGKKMTGIVGGADGNVYGAI